MSDLKPCPFCGGKAYTYTASAGKNKPLVWLAHCKECWLNYPSIKLVCATEAEAIEAWNRRAHE